MSVDQWLKMLRRSRAGRFLSHWLAPRTLAFAATLLLLVAGCADGGTPANQGPNGLVVAVDAADEQLPPDDGDPDNDRLRAQLADEITCLFQPPTTVREAYAMLSEELQIPIELDAEAAPLADQAPPVRLMLNDTKLGAVLAVIGRPAKLSYTLDRGRVVIRPADKISIQ